ncbi:FAD-dependent oxidoreductase [Streptomyces sp. NA03103]|uniref:FAD-dependent oxidoreductase n=1 Tax=Streptomyces sp. NA03103 TaxID=2742134 RepID=UPI0015929EFF|nr:FAD-dependent oxidoreductase [Streptomyces sp. NA03103]QKW60040.1 FAD-dependent oxidoreductase [Streptomyces sp. NA03103]
MSRPRIVIVGAGFAGYRTARTLSRLTRHQADITLLNPTDYFLYLPLLPQVAAGILEPRRVSVSLSGTLPHVRLVLGEADGIDLDGRTVHYTGPEGEEGTLPYDRLVLAAGSVNKLLPIPGVAEHAHGFRGLPEALYLRDHVTRQVELAAAADDRAECAARCTFVVVGAGYTGTEVAAHGAMYTDAQVRKHPMRTGMRPRWMLLDVAPRVMPEMDERLSRTAERVLRQRGVDVRMGTSVKEATHDGVVLTDGTSVDTRTLVWCVGVRPDPLVESLGLPMERGRLLVDPHLQVPGRPELFACGDVAAVPDLNQPGQYTPMTAQHAWRHGKVCAHNVVASLGRGQRRAHRHRDLGFVVDLGGAKAAANPLGVPMSGPAAGAVTRGYHLAAMPGNRVRVAADWLLDAVLPRQAVQLGLVRSWSVPLESSSPEVARVPGRPEAGRPEGAGRPATPTTPDRQRSDTEPEGEQAGGTTNDAAAKNQPDSEPARSRPGGEPAGNQPGGEPAKARPGSEPAKAQPGGQPAKNQPGGEPAKNQPGSEPAKAQPGSEPAKNQPHGERAKKGPSGSPRASGKPRRAVEAAGPRPARGGSGRPGKAPRASGAGSAGKHPAAPSGPSRSAGPPTDPGPEPPANQPPPGPDIAPGPVKRTDGRAAEGDS